MPPRPPFRLALAICIPALALTACTSSGGPYPSLARRDAERIAGTAAVVPGEAAVPQPPAPPDADIVARLARLVGNAREAHQRFLAARSRAERLVAAASGAAVASESWAVATIALAQLESARSEAMIALADLDAMHAAAQVAAAGSPSGDATAIIDARSTVIALVNEEDAVLARLRGRMRA